MRKIISKKDEDKKKRRNAYVSGIVLIFIMFFSTAGFAFVNFSSHNAGEGNQYINTINYNGFEFTEQNNFWLLNNEERNFIFRFNPNQVEKINSEINPLVNYENKALYVHSENFLARSEISANLRQFAESIENACLENSEDCNEDLPVKTCEDNFIIIRESETSGVSQNENCVFIEGKSHELVQLTDAFLFKLIKVEN